MDQFDDLYKVRIAALLRVMYATKYVKDDNVPAQIEEGLYLGSVGAANNKSLLKSLNVTHILTAANSLPPAYPNDFTYKIVDVSDREDVNIAQFFDECFSFINEAKRMGGVLVHCFVGRSRSVTIVVAYLMKKHGMSLPEALNLVKSKRSVAAPNSGFMLQLQNYEKSLQGTMAQNPNPDIDPIADAELIPEDQFLPLTPNNFHLDVTQPAIQYQVMIEILIRHPLSYALTETAEVPMIYLQQFWRSLTALEVDDGFQLEGRIDRTPVLLTRDLFRQFLHLPTVASLPGRDNFDPIVSDATLCSDIQSLGYGSNLRLPSGFNRKNLTTIWYTLFTYLNRCLSAITKGIDQTSINILRLFHAVAFHRHVDYADFLWYELLQKVRANATKRQNFIPFMRFLQLIIRNFMVLYPAIARRSSHPTCPQNPTHKIPTRLDPEGIVARQIPVGLLAYARPTTMSVIAYRHTHNLPAHMVRPKPEGPPQGARPERREGPRPRTRGGSIRIAGAPGQGVMRENIVRGTGVGTAVRPSQASTSRRSPTPPRTTSPTVEEDTATETANVQSSSAIESKEATGTSGTQSEAATESEEAADQSGSQSETFTQASESNDESSDSDGDDDEPSPGETRRAEGVIVEKESVRRERESRSKLNSECTRVMAQPVDLHQPTSSQVATSATQSHVLRQGIKGAVVDLAAQMHTPPSHSAISQQMVVSSSHGDLAQTLPVSRLESSGIETREQQPPFSTSLGAQSLEPFDVISPIPRTQIPFSATAGGLSGPAGTPIVIPSSVGLRGLGGSPTTTIITPAVNVGGSTSTVVTRTGSLSDPRVIHPEFVSREFLDGALKTVCSIMRSELREEVDALKRLIKGKGPATEPEPLPPTPQPSTAAVDMSIDELKSVLLAKLLAQSQIEPTQDADLLSLLRAQASTPIPPPQPTVSLEAFQQQEAMLQSLQQTVAVLTERLSSVEDTCRSQAERLKRRHDDQDDPDHHEGEKRRRLSEPETQIVESVQVKTEGASGSVTQPEGQEQAREQVVDLVLYETPTVEKPEEIDEVHR